MCINCGNITPNLSGFQGSNPKVYKSKKPNKTLGTGKKTDQWEAARKELKKLFEANETTSCELMLSGCKKSNYLTFAHVDKRRNLTPDEITAVVLACQPCHEKVERLPHMDMREKLETIIKNRKW